jgi:hypothetical protein
MSLAVVTEATFVPWVAEPVAIAIVQAGAPHVLYAVGADAVILLRFTEPIVDAAQADAWIVGVGASGRWRLLLHALGPDLLDALSAAVARLPVRASAAGTAATIVTADCVLAGRDAAVVAGPRGVTHAARGAGSARAAASVIAAALAFAGGGAWRRAEPVVRAVLAQAALVPGVAQPVHVAVVEAGAPVVLRAVGAHAVIGIWVTRAIVDAIDADARCLAVGAARRWSLVLEALESLDGPALSGVSAGLSDRASAAGSAASIVTAHLVGAIGRARCDAGSRPVAELTQRTLATGSAAAVVATGLVGALGNARLDAGAEEVAGLALTARATRAAAAVVTADHPGAIGLASAEAIVSAHQLLGTLSARAPAAVISTGVLCGLGTGRRADAEALVATGGPVVAGAAGSAAAVVSTHLVGALGLAGACAVVQAGEAVVADAAVAAAPVVATGLALAIGCADVGLAPVGVPGAPVRLGGIWGGRHIRGPGVGPWAYSAVERRGIPSGDRHIGGACAIARSLTASSDQHER